jgi:hypothetical protein
MQKKLNIMWRENKPLVRSNWIGSSNEWRMTKNGFRANALWNGYCYGGRKWRVEVTCSARSTGRCQQVMGVQ